MDKEVKVDLNSKEYQDFSKALDIVNNNIIEINDKLAKMTDDREMSAYSGELNRLLEDRKNICREDASTIERVLKESKA